MEAGRLADPGEEPCFGRCHPDLPAPFEPGEKGGAASGIDARDGGVSGAPNMASSVVGIAVAAPDCRAAGAAGSGAAGGGA